MQNKVLIKNPYHSEWHIFKATNLNSLSLNLCKTFLYKCVKKKQNIHPFNWGETRLPAIGIKSDFEATGLLEPPAGPPSDDALVMEHHRWTWIRVMQH